MPFAILVVVVLGCNQKDNGTSTTQSNATTASPAAATAPADISGTYDITGTNENGAGQYKGTLIVTNRGDVHQFSWDTAGKKYDGVGVRAADAVGVAFSEGANGKGCGVVLYTIGSDGTLDGKAGYWETIQRNRDGNANKGHRSRRRIRYQGNKHRWQA